MRLEESRVAPRRMKTFLSVRAREREPSPEESLRTIVRIFGGRITPFMFSMRTGILREMKESRRPSVATMMRLSSLFSRKIPFMK